MNFYPEQLRRIANICEALNKLDVEISSPEIFIKNGVQLTDEDNTDFGTLSDEIGVSWSWTPPEVA